MTEAVDTQIATLPVYCRRCGKRLTNPLSIARNYGKVCWQKVNNLIGIHTILNNGKTYTSDTVQLVLGPFWEGINK